MRSYLARHMQVLFSSIGDMARTPAASINTILTIAITLLLPSLLYIGIKSSEGVSETWQGRPQISVFLQANVSDSEAQIIFQEIQLHPAIELAEFVSPTQALEEFRLLTESASLDQELDFIGGNPLPASIVLMPNKTSAKPAEMERLKESLNKIEGIESIRLDLAWTQRFNAILQTATRIGLLLSVLLGIGLVLIVGNTIKLLIYNRRDEIEITKLVGGSNAFVRRPFLYYGTLYGLFGGIISVILLFSAAILVSEPMNALASLYQRETLMYQPKTWEIGCIVLVGSLLGWLAARWSVMQHLWKIKPR